MFIRRLGAAALLAGILTTATASAQTSAAELRTAINSTFDSEIYWPVASAMAHAKACGQPDFAMAFETRLRAVYARVNDNPAIVERGLRNEQRRVGTPAACSSDELADRSMTAVRSLMRIEELVTRWEKLP